MNCYSVFKTGASPVLSSILIVLLGYGHSSFPDPDCHGDAFIICTISWNFGIIRQFGKVAASIERHSLTIRAREIIHSDPSTETQHLFSLLPNVPFLRQHISKTNNLYNCSPVSLDPFSSMTYNHIAVDSFTVEGGVGFDFRT